MLASAIISRVQNNFGDTNQVVIYESNIIDWINEGCMEIVRETQCLSKTETSIVASAFNNAAGVGINDLILLKRIYYGDEPLLLVDFEAMGRLGFKASSGIPTGYYTEGNKIFLYPTPVNNNTTPMTILYVPAPVEITANGQTPGIPFQYHGDLAEWCLAKAHEKNENYRASELIMARFRANISKRKFESLSLDDSYRTVAPDIMDQEYGYELS